MGVWRSFRRGLASAALLTAALSLGCGRTSRNAPGSSTEPNAAGASNGDAAAPSDAPNCAVSIASAISATGGGQHCAVYQDGSVWCWGSAPGEATDEPVKIDLQDIVRVVVGSAHSCALDKAGALWCWGDNSAGQIDDSGQTPLPPTRVKADPVLGTITGLGLGETQTCVLDSLAHVYCWGTDASGQTSGPRPVDVAGDADPIMPGNTPYVIDARGRVFDLAKWDAPQELSFFGSDNAWLGQRGDPCALKRNGSLWCTEYLSNAPNPLLLVNETLGETVVQGGVGYGFECALNQTGKVWCEGFDAGGQTGNGQNTVTTDGAFVPALSDVRSIAIGAVSACSLKRDGSVWCWGAYGGVAAKSNAPVQVSGCVQQAIEPPEPAPLSTAPPDVTEHLAEAGRARGQALCTCSQVPADTLAGCISAEDFAPNAACAAALARDASQYWNCRTAQLWQEAACWSAATCAAGKLPSCTGPDTCDPTGMPPFESYCRRQSCVLDQDQNLSKYQICDGVVDCTDGSDERNCIAGTGLFQCATGDRSITLAHLCDAVPDCEDGSDEQFCP